MTLKFHVNTCDTNAMPLAIVDCCSAVRTIDGGDNSGSLHVYSGSTSVVISEGDQFDFAMALALLRAGKRVARCGWNGKDMFVFLVPGSTFQVNRPPLLGIFSEGTPVTYCPHIDMKAADGSVFTWTPNALDLLATDWRLVGEA